MNAEAYFDAIRDGNVERLSELLAAQPELLQARTAMRLTPTPVVTRCMRRRR